MSSIGGERDGGRRASRRGRCGKSDAGRWGSFGASGYARFARVRLAVVVACARFAPAWPGGGGVARAAVLGGPGGGESRVSRAAGGAAEDALVGRDSGTAVSNDYAPPFAFDGALDDLTITLGPLALPDLDRLRPPAATGPAH